MMVNLKQEVQRRARDYCGKQHMAYQVRRAVARGKGRDHRRLAAELMRFLADRSRDFAEDADERPPDGGVGGTG